MQPHAAAALVEQTRSAATELPKMENGKSSDSDLLRDPGNAAASVNATAFWSNDSGLADSGPGPVIADFSSWMKSV